MIDQRIFFDERAQDWEKNCYPPEVRGNLEALILEFGIQAGARVLDVGTGPGVLNPYLRRLAGPSGVIVSFDLSGGMVREACKKPRTSRDLLFQGDVQRLALVESFFDQIICFAAFPHFPDPCMALCEMARVVKPGGEVVIAHLLSREELARHHGGHQVVAGDILPDAADMGELFERAGLGVPVIVDRPGRYLARARRQ